MATFKINIGKEELGEKVDKGDLLYLESDGKYYKADASDHGKSTTDLRLALTGGSAGEFIDLLPAGHFKFDNANLIPNSLYYVSDTPGEITLVKYNTSDRLVRIVGTAITNDTLIFNPDTTYIKGDGTEVNDVEINDGNTYTKDEIDQMLASGGDLNYFYVQDTASNEWTINHALIKPRPSVTILDDDDNIIYSQVKYITDNQIKVYFNSSLTGKVALN